MLIQKITLLLLITEFYTISANSNLSSGLTNIVEQAEEKKIKDHKVLNYTFKQRMRTQWIARDALLISMNINSNFYKQEILKNANLFNENFNSLLESKKDIEEAKQHDSNFTKILTDLQERWVHFYDSIKKISKNPTDTKSLKFIEENNIQLLKSIDYIVTNFIKSYQSQNKLEASMVHIKSILYAEIGKPRMYMNKLVKEKLLVRRNIHEKENQTNLTKSIIEMDKLMKALKDGDKELELNGTEDRKILELLSISQNIWEEVKELVKKKTLTSQELELLIKKNDEFIEAHTQVVILSRNSNDN